MNELKAFSGQVRRELSEGICFQDASDFASNQGEDGMNALAPKNSAGGAV
jgi:hypothetical protein